MSAFIVVCKKGEKETCMTIPLTLERAIETVRTMTTNLGDTQRTPVALMGEGEGFFGHTGDTNYYIKPAIATIEDKMLSVELAKRLRFERGLRLPLGVGYENDTLEEIAREQATLFDRLDELDQKLQSL
jgi:hypothetical protein